MEALGDVSEALGRILEILEVILDSWGRLRHEKGVHVTQTDEQGTIEKTKYSLPSYINGYWNKVSSTQIYKKQATKLQEILQPVPVYAILNGQGEIVVATSTDSRTSNNPTVNEAVYDFCGSFDPFVERSKQLGLFFMSKGDAEVYLKEIAKADTQGTKMFGPKNVGPKK